MIPNTRQEEKKLRPNSFRQEVDRLFQTQGWGIIQVKTKNIGAYLYVGKTKPLTKTKHLTIRGI